jgi:D-alanyl-D-alanine carboxypeptidase
MQRGERTRPAIPLSGGRRRRRWPRPLLLLLVAAAAALAAAHELAQPGARRTPTAAAAPAAARREVRPPAPVAPRTPRLLVERRPRPRHRFRPPLAGRAAIVVDARSGSVLWGAHEHERLFVASTTKIMTALLALDRLRLRARVTIPRAVPRVALVREGLRAGERVAVWKLLDGLLIYSGNDDALALALAVGGSRAAFVDLMNERARALGLHDTHFATPSGVVDRDNRSSAWDLAALTRYALRDPRFRAIVRTRIARVRWSAPTYEKVYVNKNPLLGSYRGADGVKTGWTTKAGHCLVASAHRRGVRLIAVVLGSRNAPGDARRLLDYGFAVVR